MTALHDVAQRQARLQTRHRLDGSAPDVETAVASVGVLHATDPATVYLSVLARDAAATTASLAAALYERRTLVRMMAMRRTLFVVPRDRAPTVHHAASVGVAATMRKTLLSQLRTFPTDPDVSDLDLPVWLSGVEAETIAALDRLGTATGAQLGNAVPLLRTAFLPRPGKSYETRRSITSQVLSHLGAAGALVRGRPQGGWTSRQHVWEPARLWWPDGLGDVDPAAARADLVADYLRVFGPASEVDVAWWTGWTKAATRAALTSAARVDGLFVAADDTDPVELPDPVVAFLPALDPTPMGWKQRDWFLPGDWSGLYDAFGNIGPTIWWGGEIIGLWASGPTGDVRTRLLVDRGSNAGAAVDGQAARLSERLEGTVIVPSFRTPWERELSR